MESFDGSRRRDSRPPLSPAERRTPREPEPLEQRLDRWMSTGRQLVEGVSGGRPGARPGSRRPEARPGPRGGFDGLGRWVENRLDWLLDDSDDWPEPWQQSERRGSEPPPPPGPARPRGADRPAPGSVRARRPLQAISRRGMAPVDRAATDPGTTTAVPAGERQPRDPKDRFSGAGADAWSAAEASSERREDWPGDETFSVPRWQRAAAPLQRQDPLRREPQQLEHEPANGNGDPALAPSRPLPRSSRRR